MAGGVTILLENYSANDNDNDDDYDKYDVDGEFNISSGCELTETIIDYIYSQSRANKEEIEQQWIRCYDVVQSGFYNKMLNDYHHRLHSIMDNKLLLSTALLVVSTINYLNNSKLYEYLIVDNMLKYINYYPSEESNVELRSSEDEKDIELVQGQSGCDRITAINALERNNWDIVNAIMDLTM